MIVSDWLAPKPMKVLQKKNAKIEREREKKNLIAKKRRENNVFGRYW